MTWKSNQALSMALVDQTVFRRLSYLSKACLTASLTKAGNDFHESFISSLSKRSWSALGTRTIVSLIVVLIPWIKAV